MHTRSRLFTAVLAAVAAIWGVAAPASAQQWADRFTIHGSLTDGYGKADGEQYFGISREGTAKYHALALQLGYMIASQDRVVVQLLNRQIGDSPLMSLEPSVAPVWAFYEHRAGGWTFKVGRNPLPRGLFNEVRFIGTLLPFYRVGKDVYGETLENIDGLVVSRRFNVGAWGIDANAFTGNFGIKALLPQASSVLAYHAKAGNSMGASVIVRTPVPGVRVGAFVDDYAKLPKSSGDRSRTFLYSFDGDWSRGWVRSEYTTFQDRQYSKPNYAAWYGQAGIKISEKWQVAAEHGDGKFTVDLPQPFVSADIPFSAYNGVALNFSPMSALRLKLEYNKQQGYIFDNVVPIFTGPTSMNPPVMGVAPKSKSNYMIASVAVTF